MAIMLRLIIREKILYNKILSLSISFSLSYTCMMFLKRLKNKKFRKRIRFLKIIIDTFLIHTYESVNAFRK